VLSVLVDRADISGGDDVDLQVSHRMHRRELVPDLQTGQELSEGVTDANSTCRVSSSSGMFTTNLMHPGPRWSQLAGGQPLHVDGNPGPIEPFRVLGEDVMVPKDVKGSDNSRQSVTSLIVAGPAEMMSATHIPIPTLRI
jgi:hypothetical protein